MSRDFPVSGLKQLDDYLSALPKNMQRNAYSAGLRAAAAVVRDEAKIRAPKKTGAMAKAITRGSVHKNPDRTLSINVSLKGLHSFLGLFHEYGVKPHLITVPDEVVDAADASLKPLKNGRSRSRATLMKHVNKHVAAGSLVINGNFVGPVVHHPGHAAQPFLLPALDAKADEAVAAFAEKIRLYLLNKTGFDAGVDLDEAA